MATEKKLKDPAEAALSAIEQALNLDALTPNGIEGRSEPRLPDVGDAAPLLNGGLDQAGPPNPPPAPCRRASISTRRSFPTCRRPALTARGARAGSCPPTARWWPTTTG